MILSCCLKIIQTVEGGGNRDEYGVTRENQLKEEAASANIEKYGSESFR